MKKIIYYGSGNRNTIPQRPAFPWNWFFAGVAAMLILLVVFVIWNSLVKNQVGIISVPGGVQRSEIVRQNYIRGMVHPVALPNP